MPPKRKADDMTSSPLTPLSEEVRAAQQQEQREYLIASGIIADDDVPSSPLAKKAKKEKKVASAMQEEVSVTSDIPGGVVAKESAKQGMVTPPVTSGSEDAPATSAVTESAVTALAKDGATEKPKKVARKRKADAPATATGEQEPPKSPKKATRKRKTAATETSADNTAPGALNGDDAVAPPTKRKKAALEKTTSKKIKDQVLPESIDELTAATAAKFELPPLSTAVQHKCKTSKATSKTTPSATSNALSITTATP